MKSGLPLTLAAISIGAISLGLIWEGTNKSRDDSKSQKSQQSSHSHYSSSREHMSYGQSRHKRAKFNAVDRLKKLYENYPEVAIDLNFNDINLNAAIANLFPSNREDQKYTDLETCALKLNSDEAYDLELLASVIESHRQELDTLLQLESFHVPPDDSIHPRSYRKASRLLQVYLAHSILNDSFEEASRANNILKGITNELARAPLMGHSVAIAGNLEQNAIIHRMSLKFPALTNELSAYLDTQLNSSHFRECMKSETAAINQLLYNYTNLGEDGSLYLSSAELYGGSEDGRIPLDLFEQAATEIMLNSIAIVEPYLEQCRKEDLQVIKSHTEANIREQYTYWNSLNSHLDPSVLMMSWGYYLESAQKSYYVTQCQQYAFQLATQTNIESLPVPINPMTDEVAYYDPSKNVIVTGLENSSAEIEVPNIATTQ